jgi:indolepyruvate ferredoxin oxidoreductase
MGGEGAPGSARRRSPTTKHVFQNIGDGTYFHSGLLAIRAAVAAGVNITYKILYNDAVAMTGGQPVDGELTVPQIARRCRRGREAHRVVTDEPTSTAPDAGFAPASTSTTATSSTPCSASCARSGRHGADLRPDLRRREAPPPQARPLPRPAARVFINERVCEGCGDCSRAVELRVGRAARDRVRPQAPIDQSSCNKDYSCVKGFCPSFVTVRRRRPRKGRAGARDGGQTIACPRAARAGAARSTSEPYGILVTGIGGTGVVTIGALLGMAAHLEGKGVLVLDMTGLAQKGGAVMSHVRIAARARGHPRVRIAAGGADLLLGCDLVVAASRCAGKMQGRHARRVNGTSR